MPHFSPGKFRKLFFAELFRNHGASMSEKAEKEQAIPDELSISPGTPWMNHSHNVAAILAGLRRQLLECDQYTASVEKTILEFQDALRSCTNRGVRLTALIQALESFQREATDDGKSLF